MAKVNTRLDYLEDKLSLLEEKIKMISDMFSLMKQNMDNIHLVLASSTVYHAPAVAPAVTPAVTPAVPLVESSGVGPVAAPSHQPAHRSRCAI